jgi:prephenate dehydrogenase
MSATGPQFERAAILGVGLIGGSVAAALRSRSMARQVVGLDPRDGQAALQLGLVDAVVTSLHDAVKGADLVVLAAPVAGNAALLRGLGELPAGTLADGVAITDVSSTKCSIIAAARESLGLLLPRFVPAHPIAGSERSGAAAASATLFDNAMVLLCPDEASAPDATDTVEAMWQMIGARTGRMAAAHHDELFATVSHWPHAVAFALAAAVGQGPLADDARRYSGAGLRDTTRVGGSSPELWADILLDNRDASLRAARSFSQEVAAIERALSDGNRPALVEALSRGARWRRSL